MQCLSVIHEKGQKWSNNEYKLTCHLIFIRHLMGQLLHGDVIQGSQDDNWSFEISW